MGKSNRMREMVCLQLAQYANTKRILEEYEAVGGLTQPPEIRQGKGRHADPTAVGALRVIEPGDDIRRMQNWVWAIEQAWAMLISDAPHKARLMERLFGLNGELTDTEASTREELMGELHISEPTLYRWREDIVHAVMVGAIEAGVLSPYGKLRVQRPGAQGASRNEQ